MRSTGVGPAGSVETRIPQEGVLLIASGPVDSGRSHQPPGATRPVVPHLPEDAADGHGPEDSGPVALDRSKSR